MGEVAWAVTIEGNMGNFLTSSQVGCFAAPEWVLTFNLPKNYFDLKPQAIQQQQKWLQESDKTSRRSPRPLSTSRLTWSSTPATCTCPCTPTSTGTMWLTQAWRPSSRSPRTRRGSMGRSWSSIKTREAERSSSRTLLSPVPWNGEALLMLWKQLWNWKRLWIKVFWTCTRLPTVMLICVTSLKESSLANRLMQSRRSLVG